MGKLYLVEMSKQQKNGQPAFWRKKPLFLSMFKTFFQKEFSFSSDGVIPGFGIGRKKWVNQQQKDDE